MGRNSKKTPGALVAGLLSDEARAERFLRRDYCGRFNGDPKRLREMMEGDARALERVEGFDFE